MENGEGLEMEGDILDRNETYKAGTSPPFVSYNVIHAVS